MIEAEKENISGFSNDGIRRFKTLHEDAQLRIAKLQEKANKSINLETKLVKPKFKPSINENSRSIAHSGNFEKRQKQFEHLKNKKIEFKKAKENQLIDKDTGQELFHPLLCAVNAAFPADRSVFEDLYENAKMKLDKERSIIEEKSQITNKKPKIDDESQQIYYRKLLYCLEEIFYLLDTDGDNQLTSSDFKSDYLPKDIIAIFFPIALDLEVKKGSCGKEYFFQSGLNLLRKINLKDKDNFLSFFSNKGVTTPIEYSFCPKINEKSLELAVQRRKDRQNSDLFEFLSKEKMRRVNKDNETLQTKVNLETESSRETRLEIRRSNNLRMI